jgi:hypothetical protein
MQTRSPYYILLSMCYGVSGWTVIFYVLFDTLSPAAAFALLGRRRHPGTPHFLLQVSSEFRALHSWSNLLIVTFLSSAIYALGLYACAKTFLPTFIVTWFYPVITLEPVYDAQSLALAMYFAPLGWAARTVLFSRSAFGRNPLVWSPGLPYGSYLFVDFVQLKPWIRSDRGRELLKRTLAVFLITGVGNTLRTTHALEGSTVQGAAGWAAIWGVTGLLVNAVLIWVGSAAWINEKKPSEY